MTHSRAVQVVAVTSGKGGVGKTQLSRHLSMALADLGRRVLLLDGNLGLGEAAPAAGIQPQKTIAHVIAGENRLADIVMEGPGGIRIIPGAAGLPSLTALSAHQYAALIHSFSEVADQLDIMVVDTATGISDMVLNFAAASHQVLVVVCNEPASISAAQNLVRLLSEDRGLFRFRVVVNGVRNAQEAKRTFDKLLSACDSLDVALHFLTHIPQDENLRTAARKECSLFDLAPRCRATQAIRQLARKVDQLPLPSAPSGHLEFFVESLVSTN